ncbi:MAG: replication factor C large subunit [Candidatus Diapherotrites archaeon]|nr:replication factor C large subunit [Candidatus Diapherotrites archaeon]
MPQLLVDKYFPKNFEEFIGNSEIVDSAKNWAQGWNDGKKQKPLLFFGQTGAGKTALAVLIAKQFGWQLFETNASNLRSKEEIERVMGAAVANASLFGGRRLILIDEVDGLQSADRGGAEAIMNLIKDSSNPIILTANGIYGERKLVPLRTLAELKEFKKINYFSIAKRLREIATLEGIEFDEEAVKELAKNSGGDFRSAIIDLESIAPNVTMEAVRALFPRQRKEKIFSIMTKIFKGKNLKEIQDATFDSEVSGEMLFRWVEENIPRQFDAKDSAIAFDKLSRADVFNGRIFRRQNYGFLRYSSLLATAGVGLSRQKEYYGWVPFQFPSLIGSLSATTSNREIRKGIASKIGKKMHCSRRQAMKDIPFIQVMLEDKDAAPSMVYFFDFDGKELANLLSTKKDTKKVKGLIENAEKISKEVIVQKSHPGQLQIS